MNATNSFAKEVNYLSKKGYQIIEEAGNWIAKKKLRTTMPSNEDAKAIFFAHNGERYYMSLDGTLDEYKSFNIPQDIEVEWIFDLIDKRFSALSESAFDLNGVAKFVNIVQLLRKVKRESLTLKAIKYLEDNLDKYDSIGGILLLESGVDLIEKSNKQALFQIFIDLIANLKKMPYAIKEKTGIINPDAISSNGINKRIEKLVRKLQEAN